MINLMAGPWRDIDTVPHRIVVRVNEKEVVIHEEIKHDNGSFYSGGDYFQLPLATNEWSKILETFLRRNN